MSDGKVTWCFTPSQPVRLYQGECQMEKWSNNVKVDKRNCGDIGFFKFFLLIDFHGLVITAA